MSRPVISVLITVFNRRKYVAEAINSVLKGHFQDFEIIVVDDCSTDGSWGLIQEIALTDKRIKIFRNKKNLGDYANRNKAAEYAKGEYLKYLDADDMHGRFMLDILFDAINTFPDAALALFDYGPNYPLFPIELSPTETYLSHYQDVHRVFDRSPGSAIIRASSFQDIGGFSGERYIGDYDLWHRICSCYPTVIVSGTGPGFYRIHDEQESSHTRRSSEIPFRYLLKSLHYLEDSESFLPRGERTLFLNKKETEISRFILGTIKREGISSAIALKKLYQRNWRTIIEQALL